MSGFKSQIKEGVIIIDFESEGYERNVNHKYISYTNKTIEGAIPVAGYEVCRSYAKKQNLNKEEWKKEKRTVICTYYEANTKEKKNSKPFNYKIVTDSIRQKGFFLPKEFDLYNIGCKWLDTSTNMKVTFHRVSDYGNAPWMIFSEGSLDEHYEKDFPIKPTLEKEGHLFSSLFPSMLKRIMKKRHFIVENSERAFEDGWLFEIKDLIIDCISLIDITLNSLYLKAEFLPLPNWKYDVEKLGSRVNRRINDKLKWVYQISGNPLNIESERVALENFRVMRNHFNHFDPPCFAITIEEVARILNQVMELGIILVKIRQALGVNSSVGLINFILQKKVTFVCEPEFSSRSNNEQKGGYISSVWS